MYKKKDSSHILDIVKQLTKPIFDKQGIHMVKLIEDWKFIIDETWSESVCPYKIVWNNSNQGILYLATKNHLVKHLVLHDSKKIIDQVNQYFGYKCIINLKFINE